MLRATAERNTFISRMQTRIEEIVSCKKKKKQKKQNGEEEDNHDEDEDESGYRKLVRTKA